MSEDQEITPGMVEKSHLEEANSSMFNYSLDQTYVSQEEEPHRRRTQTWQTQAETLLGLTKLVPPKTIRRGFIHAATHKDSGEEVPWLMRLPASHFKAANSNVDGKNYRTIGLMKGSKKLQEAWGKFGTVYGMPVFEYEESTN